MGLNCTKPGGCKFPRELCLASCSFTFQSCTACGRGEVIDGKCDRCGAPAPVPERPLAMLKAAEAAAGVPAFDFNQPCALTPHGNPILTQCPRCKNPHHKCDNGTPGVKGGSDAQA